MVKEDAEQQRLQREELELELHSVKNQMHNFKNADADLKRYISQLTCSIFYNGLNMLGNK